MGKKKKQKNFLKSKKKNLLKFFFFSQVYEYENLNNPNFYNLAGLLVNPKFFDESLKLNQKENLDFFNVYIDFLENGGQVRFFLFLRLVFNLF